MPLAVALLKVVGGRIALADHRDNRCAQPVHAPGEQVTEVLFGPAAVGAHVRDDPLGLVAVELVHGDTPGREPVGVVAVARVPVEPGQQAAHRPTCPGEREDRADVDGFEFQAGHLQAPGHLDDKRATHAAVPVEDGRAVHGAQDLRRGPPGQFVEGQRILVEADVMPGDRQRVERVTGGQGLGERLVDGGAASAVRQADIAADPARRRHRRGQLIEQAPWALRLRVRHECGELGHGAVREHIHHAEGPPSTGEHGA